jgi:hypothetical protein
VALSFEPDRVVYDDSERLIRILALDGLQLVHCAVSKAALVASPSFCWRRGARPRPRDASVSSIT